MTSRTAIQAAYQQCEGVVIIFGMPCRSASTYCCHDFLLVHPGSATSGRASPDDSMKPVNVRMAEFCICLTVMKLTWAYDA